MTKKLKILLISVLFLVATVCVCAFAGCKVKFTVDELKDKYGLSAQITYFLNSDGGKLNDSSYVKDLYYSAGQKPMNIGASTLVSGSSSLEIGKGFNFTGWYYVETDSAGKPLYADGSAYSEDDEYDVGKGMKMSDEEFNFEEPLKAGEHIYLCGDFYKDVRLVEKLLCIDYVGDGSFNHISYTEGNNTVTVKDGEEIAYGSQNIPKAGNGLDDNTAALQNKFKGYTVEGFYQKVGEEYVPFTGWPVKYPTKPNEEGKYDDVVLYVKMLQGEWDIVSTPDQVAMMFAVGSHDYYIKQDIDGNGREISNIRNLSGTIWGTAEGHTLKNFVVKSSVGQREKASVFGNITATAAIKNVTFENFTANFTVASGIGLNTNDVDINFVANTIAEGATFENVSISGSLNITLSDRSDVTATTESSWLFGNQDDKTYDKIKVLYATCTVRDKDGNIKDGKDFTVGTNNDNQTEDLK